MVCILAFLRRLSDVQAPDLSCRRELKVEIRPKVSPLLGVEVAHQVQAIVHYPVDRRESFGPDSISREILNAAWSAMVKQLRVRREQRRPSLAIAL
jgi:hypothetical protein